MQTALRNVLEPIFERDFAEQSYGFRAGRGCKDALLKEGYICVVDADLKSYFDTINHSKLLDRVEAKIADRTLLALLTSYLKQRIMETADGWTPELGTPQGAVISPLLSNIYLDPLDHLLASAGFGMVRYADDFVILCRQEQDVLTALALVARWSASVDLLLHLEKTRIVDATAAGGFDFLGYHFEQNLRRPCNKSLTKLKDRIRSTTGRCNGQSLPAIIVALNRSLVGWFEYFKHSHRKPFPRPDQWIRMRLRSILRQRHHGRGRGGGWDHFRWPNAFFAKQGLFSLVTAHALAC